MPMRLLTTVTIVFSALVAGCSSPQLYGAGQAWQRTECSRYPDPEQRQRCMASTAMSYDEYQRQQAAAKAAK
jgi:hypothetical protein